MNMMSPKDAKIIIDSKESFNRYLAIAKKWLEATPVERANTSQSMRDWYENVVLAVVKASENPDFTEEQERQRNQVMEVGPFLKGSKDNTSIDDSEVFQRLVASKDECVMALAIVMKSNIQLPIYLTMDNVLDAIFMVTGVSRREIVSPSRSSNLVEARMLAYYLGHRYCGLSFPAIGKILGGRDHSTVMHGYKMVCKKPERYGKTLDAVLWEACKLRAKEIMDNEQGFSGREHRS